MKKILVCGAGGFIGSHLVKKLKSQGAWVRGVDLKYPEFSKTVADDFVIGDLRDVQVWEKILDLQQSSRQAILLTKSINLPRIWAERGIFLPANMTRM